MKIYLNNPRESWIVDRIRKEWYDNNRDIVTENIDECDLIWIIAPWQWNLIPKNIILNKKVICTIHHIVPNKFTKNSLKEFLYRDKFVDAYHVPNKHTASFVEKITKKPIYTIGYWYNSSLWRPIDKNSSRKELNIPQDSFVVGSFQRDTEGSDLVTPKLEKGPDLFCDYVEKIKKDNLLVLLGGWRRQYVINRLNEAKINYKYIEMAPIEKVKEMYAACDLYVVSSRHEGGPQAVFEASAMKVPIISNPVGLAEMVLDKDCVFDITKKIYYPSEENVKNNFIRVKKYDIINHKEEYINIFKRICHAP